MNQVREIGFLYNHEATHQVAHSAPVAAALARLKPQWKITLYYTTLGTKTELERYLNPAQNLAFRQLDLPWLTKVVAGWVDRVVPMSRLQVLRSFASEFAKLDGLVVTELTSARLKSMWPEHRPKLITVSHGAGDRDVGFDPQFAEFDLVLQAGRKQISRFVDELGLLRPDQVKSIGYVKFDRVRFTQSVRPRLFENDNPTVLYNPHFSPDFSSWFVWGEDILSAFAEQQELNFIIAPHVMLAKRRLHGSLKSNRMIWRSDVQEAFRAYPNLLIDMGSAKSVDMTYTRAADLYLGDMSSQIYEFLLTPRPAVFLNPHDLPWRDNPEYRHWMSGDVISELADVMPAIERGLANPEHYRSVQEALFEDTFDLTDRPSTDRAADEIIACLEKHSEAE